MITQIAPKVAKIDVSVVLPIYNELENIEPLINSICEALKDIDLTYEIIAVDDGSTDGTTEKLEELSGKVKNFKSIIFRRNYGQTAAFSAGFNYARGSMIVALDADMQNDPFDIPKMIEKYKEGYDIVSGWRINRKDHIFRVIPSKIANKLISNITGVKLNDYGCSLKVYNAKIAKEISLYGEMHRFIPALASIEGARITEMPVNHFPRKYGISKCPKGRTVSVILDLLTVSFFKTFMTKPLHVFGKIGLSFLGVGLSMLLWLIYIKFCLYQSIADRPLLLFAIMFVIAGIQLISTGIIAEILSRIYFESQSKPVYKIREIYEQRISDA